MGLTVTEDITLDNGLTINSYYVSLSHNEIRIMKYGTQYIVQGTFSSWVSRELKEARMREFSRRPISIILPNAPTNNIYELLYSKLKEQLPSYVDDVPEVVEEAPVEEAPVEESPVEETSV